MFDTRNETNVISSGFHLVVKSWENDADNYQTHSMVFEDLKSATDVVALVDQWQKIYGNDSRRYDRNKFYTDGLTRDQLKFALNRSCGEDFVSNNALIDELFNDDGTLKDDSNEGHEVFGQLADSISDISGELLGYCEYYVSRVMEDWRIFEVKNDIRVESVASGDATIGDRHSR